MKCLSGSLGICSVMMCLLVFLVGCGGQPRLTERQVLATADAIRARTPTFVPFKFPGDCGREDRRAPDSDMENACEEWLKVQAQKEPTVTRRYPPYQDYDEVYREILREEGIAEATRMKLEWEADEYLRRRYHCAPTNAEADLYSGPGTDYERIGHVPRGTCLFLDGQNANGTWYAFQDVKVLGTDLVAWISANLVEDALDDLPVVEATVTPVPPNAIDEDYAGYILKAATELAQFAAAEATWMAEEQELLKRDGIIGSSCAGGCTEYPTWCEPPIKGNRSYETEERIYHLPGQEFYERTEIRPEYGERWFCTESEAQAAGWRKSRR